MRHVHALTDVTGFGLLGHLFEMAEGSHLSARLQYGHLKKFDGIGYYLQQRTQPGATSRNWNSYGSHVQLQNNVNTEEALGLLPDPQTNGGLLIAVAPEGIAAVQAVLSEAGLTEHLQPIGHFTEAGEKRIYVEP
jgi:selenide,water dikinase